MDGKRRKITMATQMADTPTLYGKDAEAVRKEIANAPSEKQIQELQKRLEKKFEGLGKREVR